MIDFYWLHRDDPEKPVEEIVDILGRNAERRQNPIFRIFQLQNRQTESVGTVPERTEKSGVTAVSNQWSLAGINPVEIPIRTLHLWSFPGRNTGGTETGAASIPFSSTAMGFSQRNFRKWEFHIRMKRWMHPGCRRKSHRLQIFQKA